MLLLSSATRILATELPPRAPTQMHGCAHTAALQRNWSIGGRGRQRKVPQGVSEGEHGHWYGFLPLVKWKNLCRARGRRQRFPLPGNDLLQSLFLLAGGLFLRVARCVVCRFGVGVRRCRGVRAISTSVWRPVVRGWRIRRASVACGCCGVIRVGRRRVRCSSDVACFHG